MVIAAAILKVNTNERKSCKVGRRVNIKQLCSAGNIEKAKTNSEIVLNNLFYINDPWKHRSGCGNNFISIDHLLIFIFFCFVSVLAIRSNIGFARPIFPGFCRVLGYSVQTQLEMLKGKREVDLDCSFCRHCPLWLRSSSAVRYAWFTLMCSTVMV